MVVKIIQHVGLVAAGIYAGCVVGLVVSLWIQIIAIIITADFQLFIIESILRPVCALGAIVGGIITELIWKRA